MSVFEILGKQIAEQVKAKAAIVEFLEVYKDYHPGEPEFEQAIDKLRECVADRQV